MFLGNNLPESIITSVAVVTAAKAGKGQYDAAIHLVAKSLVFPDHNSWGNEWSTAFTHATLELDSNDHGRFYR